MFEREAEMEQWIHSFYSQQKKQICQESELSKHFNERTFHRSNLHSKSNKSSSKYFMKRRYPRYLSLNVNISFACGKNRTTNTLTPEYSGDDSNHDNEERDASPLPLVGGVLFLSAGLPLPLPRISAISSRLRDGETIRGTDSRGMNRYS